MIEAARGSPLFAPVVLGLALGARRGEICALRWACIADDGTVTIRAALRQLTAADIRVGPPKGGKIRRVRLPPSYAALVREWKRVQAEQMLALGRRIGPDDPVCTDVVGRALTPNQITDQFAALARRLGLKMSFHGLRHTHASILLAAGESVKTVQLRLGHSKPSVTLNIYTHVIPEDGEAEAERIDAALRGSKVSSKVSSKAG